MQIHKLIQSVPVLLAAMHTHFLIEAGKLGQTAKPSEP